MKKSTQDEFIAKAKLIHGDVYDYSLVEYVQSKSKVKIICPIHGVFEQKPNCHLSGKGCYKCGRGYQSNRVNELNNNFIKRAKEIHFNCGYEYPDVYTKNNVKVKIICPKHGEFFQAPNTHLGGKGCPHCRMSKGEQSVTKFLQDNNIEFIPQKKFDDCVYKHKLPFDFYLPRYNLCIEYQGSQHFTGWHREETSLKEIQLRDSIKKDFCAKNSIGYLSIPYTEFKNVKQILASTLQVDIQSLEHSKCCQVA